MIIFHVVRFFCCLWCHRIVKNFRAENWWIILPEWRGGIGRSSLGELNSEWTLHNLSFKLCKNHTDLEFNPKCAFPNAYVWSVYVIFFLGRTQKFTISDFLKQTHFGHILITFFSNRSTLWHCFSANGLSYCSQHKIILVKHG